MIKNESNLNQGCVGGNQPAEPDKQLGEGNDQLSPILSLASGEGEVRRPVRNASEKVEPWPEPVDGNALLNALRQVLVRFVVLPAGADVVLALWTLHTYAFELRDVTTYIGIESPEKRCGKTTLMSLLSELVNRPEAAANISSPAFFRAIEETRPTLLIDESDTHLRGNHQLRGILNSGYHRRMSYVLRVTSEIPAAEREANRVRSAECEVRGEGESDPSPIIDHWSSKSRLVRFSCWCPKAIATIGSLPETLADRCLRVRMQRKTLAEKCERFSDEEAKLLAPLRRKCARFVHDHAAEITSARPEIPAGLNDRAADISEPLFVLGDLAGGEWPELARRAVAEITTRAEESNPVASLLLDIFVLFVSRNAQRLFTRDLLAGLNSWRDRPWAEMLKGKEINDLWLAKRLRPYGIRPKTIWIGEERAKGYVQSECLDVFRRYITRAEWEAFKAQAGCEKPNEGNEKSEGEAPTAEGGSPQA